MQSTRWRGEEGRLHDKTKQVRQSTTHTSYLHTTLRPSPCSSESSPILHELGLPQATSRDCPAWVRDLLELGLSDNIIVDLGPQGRFLGSGIPGERESGASIKKRI